MFFKPKYKQLTDEQLVKRMVKGDTKSFDELYHRYYEKLYYYFYRMLGQQTGLAADYTQDLFVKLIEKAITFDINRKFSTWIYTIANNMCKNAYRAKQYQKIVLSVEEDWEAYAALLEVEIENTVELSAFQQDLLVAIEGLKPKHKVCFVLRYQQGFTIKEISEIEQVPAGTIKSRIYYALQQLAKELMIYNPNKK